MKKRPQVKKPKNIGLVLVIAAVAFLGFSAMIESHAATFATSSEAEAGTVSGNATTVSDTNASGSSAVKFGTSSSGGGITFNHCTNPTYTIPSNLNDPQSGVSLGGYYVDNDNWNFSKYPSSQQTIFVCNFDNWYTTMTLSDTANNGEVKTYPSIHKDYSEVGINTFTNISSIYAHTAPSNGAWDVAYDIWLNNYGVELMIWTQSNGRQAHVPGIPQVASVSLSGITYNIHKSGSYIAYDMPSTRTSGNINIKEIFNDMISRGYITSTAKLSSIQYGVEGCDTGGVSTKFEFNNFSVTSN